MSSYGIWLGVSLLVFLLIPSRFLKLWYWGLAFLVLSVLSAKEAMPLQHNVEFILSS